ncbi:hypothetical protein DCAR_0310245 [Daucus carota subsp. sativus]|uniref:Myb-like domain-containing protein n=1 Tax=Daucus carota subsp. sativus TaxID=79200 RepID=A0AAF0WJG3_DAUCS|nr:hypothetical protein DCAR_0310245 [Daucus carota subsp. sativus]
MTSSPNASSWLPWIWALETLAYNHADSSLLIDLMKLIPDNVVDNGGNVAKESAFLRILEGFPGSRKGECCGDSLKLDSNAGGFGSLKLLRKCSGRNHELSESEMLRLDVDTGLPKCTLRKLKDMILKDSHLLPSYLKERSGLLKCSDGVTKRLPEGSNCDAAENPKVRDLSSGKRGINDLTTANEGMVSACRELIVYNAYPDVKAATKRKWDTFCTQQVIEGNDSASFHENRHVEDTSGGIVLYSGRDGSNLDSEPWAKSFHGDMPSENVDDNHRREILSSDDIDHDENDDSIAREDILLETQNSDSQDSLANVNGTKEQLCMMCKLGDQLLVCSSGSCQRVVHERCLGFAPTFDAKRRFYCPFCAYFRAVSEYSDSKKQYALTKNALLSFKNRLRNSDISGRGDRNHVRDSEVSDKCTEQNNLENVVSRVNQVQSMMRMREKSSVSCDLSSRVGERDVTCGGNMADKQNAETIGSSVYCQSTKEQVQKVPELDVQNCKAYNSLHGGSKQLAVVEKLQKVLQQPNGVILVTNNEEQKIALRAVKDSKVPDSDKYLKISHRNDPRTGADREQDVSNQPHVLPRELAKPLRSLGVQKQEQHIPYPSVPQYRRKKVPWSDAEEEALKEGVRRFASDNNRTMPWKRILEFGAQIFEKHRTAIDLKDKWRNMCKASPVV